MKHVAYLIADRARLLRRAFDDRVRTLGVTGPQARLLLYLSRQEGENQGHYAEQLDVEPITLTRMIDRMAEAGMVERRPDPCDRRAWRLHLTAKSRAFVAELRSSIDAMTDDMLAGISLDDRETLGRVLTAIGANLGDRRDSKVANNG